MQRGITSSGLTGGVPCRVDALTCLVCSESLAQMNQQLQHLVSPAGGRHGSESGRSQLGGPMNDSVYSSYSRNLDLLHPRRLRRAAPSVWSGQAKHMINLFFDIGAEVILRRQ